MDLRQIASGWKMDEELQGSKINPLVSLMNQYGFKGYDRALQELRRALVRVFETSEQANIEYDYSSQKHKEVTALSLNILKCL